MRQTLLGELTDHFQQYRQMIFLSGPRQVGKTTLARMLSDNFAASEYLTWDDIHHRQQILDGPGAVAQLQSLGGQLEVVQPAQPLYIFDELHKYKDWRGFLKGFFDQHENQARVLVIGSASLQIFRRGGDSLMGRYFPWTLHPVSVAECVEGQGRQPTDGLINPEPVAIDEAQWQALWRFGGFPEPFLKSERRFYNRWRQLRTEQLFRDDLRDLTRIQEVGQVEALAELIRQQVGQLSSYASLARNVRASVDSVRRWVATLESLYYCFAIKPWHSNVARALRKEPKYYLWDWSAVEDEGARAENMVASALLKATHWWTESGLGNFGLWFLRDKDKREVDFLVTRDHSPWFLVEVKLSQQASLSASLGHFQRQVRADHAFQVAWDADYIGRNCFEVTTPVIVPAKTLLAQLV